MNIQLRDRRMVSLVLLLVGLFIMSVAGLALMLQSTGKGSTAVGPPPAPTTAAPAASASDGTVTLFCLANNEAMYSYHIGTIQRQFVENGLAWAQMVNSADETFHVGIDYCRYGEISQSLQGNGVPAMICPFPRPGNGFVYLGSVVGQGVSGQGTTYYKLNHEGIVNYVETEKNCSAGSAQLKEAVK